MLKDGKETITETTEAPKPLPKTEVNWNAFAVVAVVFVTMVLGFFFLIVLVGKLFPW